MKVFKFYVDDLFYAYSGATALEVINKFSEDISEIADKIEEIPELEWDEKIITTWEDNDFSKDPYKISIRDVICGEDPQMVYTNDFSLF